MKTCYIETPIGGGWLIRLRRLRNEVNFQKNLSLRPSREVNFPQLTKLTILTTWGYRHFSQREVERR